MDHQLEMDNQFLVIGRELAAVFACVSARRRRELYGQVF